MIRFTQVLTFVFSIAVSNHLFSHHSSIPHFDNDKEIVIEGIFKEIKFVNPHAYIYFDEVVNGDLVGWRCELSSATQLKRRGWTDELFAPGQEITISGGPARREDNVCYMKSVTLADGTTLERYADLTQMKDQIAAAAIEAPEQTERAKYLENGQPNFQGSWISKSFGPDALGIRPGYTATEVGEAAAEGYEMAFDDPILQCHIVNIFNGWNHDENVNEISQNEDSITLRYGFMDFVRTIHLNMDQHPENLEPSTGGHSIGYWDGDTLVVDTIGFEEGILSHRSGLRHSNQMHSIERFYYDEETEYLVRDYTLTDPLYLVGETKGQDMMAISDAPYSPYNCIELSGKNNIRPSELPQEEDLDVVPTLEEAPAEKPWWNFWD